MHAAHVQWLAEHQTHAAVLQTVKQLAPQIAIEPRAEDLRATRALLVYLADYPQRRLVLAHRARGARGLSGRRTAAGRCRLASDR